MKNLLWLPSLLFSSALFAQTPQSPDTANMVQANLTESIQVLTQNALFVLTGIVVFAALVWLVCIVKSCTNLNKKTRHNGLTVLFFFSAIAIVPAQTTLSHATTVDITNPAIFAVLGIVDLLQQYALSSLTTFVLILGLAWMGYLCYGFLSLKKPYKSKVTIFSLLLFAGIGLSTLGSSCTAAQRARAADIRAAQATDFGSCPMNQHIDAQAHSAYTYNQGYGNWRGPVHCRRCGQRLSHTSN
jgi:hypothetical protein